MYVLLWPRCPAEGRVCAMCMTSGRQGSGTTRCFVSLATAYNISFSTIKHSLYPFAASCPVTTLTYNGLRVPSAPAKPQCPSAVPLCLWLQSVLHQALPISAASRSGVAAMTYEDFLCPRQRLSSNSMKGSALWSLFLGQRVPPPPIKTWAGLAVW